MYIFQIIIQDIKLKPSTKTNAKNSKSSTDATKSVSEEEGDEEPGSPEPGYLDTTSLVSHAKKGEMILKPGLLAAVDFMLGMLRRKI
tara:strand:- start:597 stop:857 length:261 start_codon:yes stop_codon:yes gene_type:complete